MPSQNKDCCSWWGNIGSLAMRGGFSERVFFAEKKNVPHTENLVEVDLEEGETLTYLVDHDINVQGGGVQKGRFDLEIKSLTN